MGYLFTFGLFFLSGNVSAECVADASMLNHYEEQILRAAGQSQFAEMAEPLACILRMQQEAGGLDRLLAASYLRPILSGESPKALLKDHRYRKIAKALEQISLHEADSLKGSFVAEFSRGDWSFYTLFCEQGNTEFCTDFLPNEATVRAQPPLVAAASMLRLRQAYKVLDGRQKDLIARRLQALYRQIPKSDRLRRKFINQIYRDLFPVSDTAPT